MVQAEHTSCNMWVYCFVISMVTELHCTRYSADRKSRLSFLLKCSVFTPQKDPEIRLLC